MYSFLESLLAAQAFTFNHETLCFQYQFGDGYEISIEPLTSQQFHLALYQHRVLLWPSKIPIQMGYAMPTGPGDEQEERRKIMREYLQEMTDALEKADREARGEEE